MTIKRYTWAVFMILLVPFAAFVLSCQNPISPVEAKAAAPTGKQGTLSINVQHVSPVVLGVFSGKSTARNLTKAYFAADRVHFKLQQTSGQQTTVVQEWDQTISPSQTIFTNNMMNGSAFQATDTTVPVGTGYTLGVQIFNNAQSTTQAVVGGTSASFDVTNGNRTSVSVTCVPLNPDTSLVKGTASPLITLNPPWSITMGTSPTVNSVGAEKWFKIAMNNSNLMQFTLTPTASSYVGFFLYDANGSMLNGGGGSGPGQPIALSYATTSGSTYYVGVLDVGTGTGRGFTFMYKESPPTGFYVSDANTDHLTVSWDAAPGATGYAVYRNTGSSQSGWVQVYSGMPTTTPLSFTDYSVTSYATYYYWIQAYYSNTSAWSAVSSSPVSGYTQLAAPSTPTVGLSVSSATTSSLYVSWSPVAYATDYILYRDISPNGNFATVLTGVSVSPYTPYYSTYFTDTNLNYNTTYYYKIQAHNSAGTSPMSAAFTGTTLNLSPPATPTGGYVSSSATNTLTVNWDNMGSGLTYTVFRDTSSTSTFTSQVYSGTSNTFTDAGLSSGVTYYYEVQASNALYSSAKSAPFYGTTQGLVITGFNLSLTSDLTNVTAVWNAVAGASYETYIYPDNSYLYYYYPTTNSQVIPVPSSGTQYYFYLMAYSGSSSTPWSKINYQQITLAPSNYTTPQVIYFTPYTSGNYYVAWSDSFYGAGGDTVDGMVQMPGFFSWYDSGYSSSAHLVTNLVGGQTYEIDLKPYYSTGSGTMRVWMYPTP